MSSKEKEKEKKPKTFFEKWGVLIIIFIIILLVAFLMVSYYYYTSWVNKRKIEKILNNPRPKTWKQVIKKIKNIDTVSSSDKTFYSNFIKYQRKWGILVNKKKNLCVNKDKWRNALIKTEHLPEGTNQPSWLYLQESDVDDFISVLGKCIKTYIKSKHP